mgnify:CR=1 FL=1
MDQNRLSCLNIVADLLSRCDTGKCVFPPTELYNEGWLLRIVLDWFSSHNIIEHELNFTPGCTWYSEALLPSPFLPRFRGDPLSESHTHADGLIGHIVMGSGGKAGTSLKPDARHLVVVEAKMFSRLSAGVKNAPYYDQAARYVACVAELLRRANRKLSDIERLGLYIVAPDETIDAGWIEACMNRENIRAVVEKRVRHMVENETSGLPSGFCRWPKTLITAAWVGRRFCSW